ncbi:MAG TPA: c-type cytochrome, partial [Planctomycetes bacterium]|nr:c-type cytochrome [Planctomycetota bacterium]
ALWISDWVTGWVGKGKGRLYRVFEPASLATQKAASARALLSQRFEDLEVDRLADLLSHADQRVRLRAQHALTFRPSEGEPVFREIIWSESLPRRARLHAIWGLGVLHRRVGANLDDLIPLLGDRDDEVRGQIAKLLGEAHVAEARPVLEELLADESSRVRYFAAQALGAVGTTRSLSPLAGLLSENADRDVILRHGAVMALVGIANREARALDGMAGHPNPSVRLAVLLALAKRKDPGVAHFLTDAPALAREAARAVFDREIKQAYPDLARLIDPPSSDEVVLRRAIAAAEALGGKKWGASLVRLAGDAHRVRAELRALALEAIRRWDDPQPRDPVLGSYRPRDPWPQSEVAPLLAPKMRGLLTATSDELVKAALPLLVHWNVHDHGSILLGLVASEDRTLAVRRAALRALIDLEAPELEEAARVALAAKAPKLRADAAGAMAKLAPRTALPLIQRALTEGSVPEKQAAMLALGNLRGAEAEALLADLGERLLRGEAPAEYALELARVLTSRADPSPEVRRLRTSWERARAALTDPVDRRNLALAGGDPVRGRKVFRRDGLSCRRCHAVDGHGEGLAGPDLSEVGDRLDARHLLEAVVDPGRTIVKGYGTEMVFTRDGRGHQGQVVEETRDTLRLRTNDYGRLEVVAIPKKDIAERRQGGSAMPSDVSTKLNDRDLRDLIAYLRSLRKR